MRRTIGWDGGKKREETIVHWMIKPLDARTIAERSVTVVVTIVTLLDL